MALELPQQSAGYARSGNPVWAWWRDRAIATVDHDAVLRKVAQEAGWSARYALMVVISAGISILGLLLPSSAVLIGAMLISPLMMPIIGMGFALATFDFDEMRSAGFALGAGAVIAILLCAAFVVLSPVQTVTSEIAVRTHPNLFDLLVALLSALAGSYALIRGRGETVVGVAIAIALMPPLAVVGFGIATANWTIAGGALLLFMTNLVTIGLTAAFVARLYGFGSHLTPAHTRLQSILMIVGLTALAVPLALTLRQIAWEALASRQIRDTVQAQFPAGARISDIETDFRADPIKVVATVLTPAYAPEVERQAQSILTTNLRRRMSLTVDQVRIGSGDADSAQVVAAQTRDRQPSVDLIAQKVADRLATIAGIPADAVIVDRASRRAIAMVQPIEGATLGLYRQLEARATAGLKDWTIYLAPPPQPLPSIAMEGDAVAAEAGDALDLSAWAIRRQSLPVVVRGSEAKAEAVRAGLIARGVDAARLRVDVEQRRIVALSWVLPD